MADMLHLQHVVGITWMRVYKAFIAYPGGPDAYFALITTPEKTLGQVGQISGVAVAGESTAAKGRSQTHS